MVVAKQEGTTSITLRGGLFTETTKGPEKKKFCPKKNNASSYCSLKGHVSDKHFKNNTKLLCSTKVLEKPKAKISFERVGYKID